MGEIADLTGAPMCIVLKGETYTLSPLTFGDIGMLETYIQYRDWYNLSQSGAPQELLDKVFYNCCKNKVRIGQDEFAQNIEHPDVLLELVFYMIKPNHPEVKKAELSRKIDTESIASQFDKIVLASGLRSVGDDDPKN